MNTLKDIATLCNWRRMSKPIAENSLEADANLHIEASIHPSLGEGTRSSSFRARKVNGMMSGREKKGEGGGRNHPVSFIVTCADGEAVFWPTHGTSMKCIHW
ncbi:hypothetical protein CDAR_493571 [Caerostris darwini]|uniref:Uncharacterized protein n=1 Tax=Caerostris darwini TaxID=1538125 RepID=A0AAV4VTQ8_9ARAC|nr:hypothetical protein CDAR_493571 [Caerostris darwini]